MLYNNFQNKKLPALGMGCMRLPGGGYGNEYIDIETTEKMVEYAMNNGVNYFDTAWGYHCGKSEIVIGEILKKYPRESFYLASKFPGYDLSLVGKVEEIFEEQLKKCQVDYFDFYMFHNVCEVNIDAYLDEKHGIFEYLLKQKQNGRIKHLGFSAHGSLDVMKRFIEKYGKDMEFCQIQLNWLDWHFQGADKKVDLLNSHNIPIWVMEPLRGGSLVKLDDEQKDRLMKLKPDFSVPQWSFSFLQNIKGVTVTLSGMSTFEQMKENIDIYNTINVLSEDEREALFGIAKEKTSKNTLPCTACQYCVTHCPQEINIPRIIELYNEQIYSGGGFLINLSVRSLPDEKKPSACLHCRACEEVCPQNIKISEMMSDFSEKLKL